MSFSFPILPSGHLLAIEGLEPPPEEQVRHIRESMAELAELGIEAMDD